MSVTACTDSLNAKTVNVKYVSALCAKCVMIKKHDLCVSKPIAKPIRKTVASESIKKPRNNVKNLNERFGKSYKWTYIKFTPSGYMWKPKSTKENVNPNVSMPLETEDSNSKTASNKSVKESSLNSATKDVHEIKYKMSKEKERCMTYFQSLHSHLQVLSKKDLKGTRIEHGFKRAFMSLFGQDADTFTSTMLLNVDHLQKQLDKAEFQEDGSTTAFWEVNSQFQKFIDSQVTLDYDSQMTEKYFVEYTG
nr:hypothetical protein [Tanacetum cinerariifolium]